MHHCHSVKLSAHATVRLQWCFSDLLWGKDRVAWNARKKNTVIVGGAVKCTASYGSYCLYFIYHIYPLNVIVRTEKGYQSRNRNHCRGNTEIAAEFILVFLYLYPVLGLCRKCTGNKSNKSGTDVCSTLCLLSVHLHKNQQAANAVPEKKKMFYTHLHISK